MDEIKRYLDTYALVEIAKGNPKFVGYLVSDFVITDLTLAEFYLVTLREEGDAVANYWFRKLEKHSVQVSKKILIEAMKFKHEYRKKEISFFDAVGYVFSVNQKYLFVTGDKEFEGLPNVEFRRK